MCAKIVEQRMTQELTLVKVFERTFEGRKYYKARMLDVNGEVYDLNVQDQLIQDKPEVLSYLNQNVIASLKLTSGQFNRATPVLVDLQK